MSSAAGHIEYSKRRLSRPKSGQNSRIEPDAELTEFLVPAPTSRAGLQRAPFEAKAQDASQHPRLSKYSNTELPEVVVPKPASTHRAERQRSLSAEQLKTRESNKCFVPDSASPQSQGETVNKDRQAQSQLQSMLASPATKLYTIAHLILFSILGTLARLGMEAMTFYPSAPVTSSVLWPNFAGSIVLGFLNQDQRIFREEWGSFSSPEDWSFHPTNLEPSDTDAIQNAVQSHNNVKKTIPLYIGLATGFCGSFTSFSSFIRDAFLALSNGLASPLLGPSIPSRNSGYSVEALLAILILHIAVSISGLKLGAHLAMAVDPVMPTAPFKAVRKFLDPVIVFLGFGCWIGAVFLTVYPPRQAWRGRVTYALLFAPLGCLLRFYTSKQLNPRVVAFPLGTFAVNMFGTVILGTCFDLQHSRILETDLVSCWILEGVMDGFCGCATTVSTWVAELNGLKRRHSYIYGFTSVTVGLSFLIVIMGSLQWSQGFQKPRCT